MEIFNRQARFNYQILDSLEAGIMLSGPEVKSVKNGQATLTDGYVRIRNGEAWLLNVHIAPFGPAGNADYNPLRERKLLLNKKEIESLSSKLHEQGLGLMPLKMYITRNRIKVEIGLGKGKKKYDKRESIKSRELDRIIRRKTK